MNIITKIRNKFKKSSDKSNGEVMGIEEISFSSKQSNSPTMTPKSSVFRDTFISNERYKNKKELNPEKEVILTQLKEITEYLYDTTLHTTNVKFTSKNALLDVENAMRANKVFMALTKARLLYDLLNNGTVLVDSVKPYMSDFNFILETIQLNDWLVIVSDNYIADLLIDTFNKPLEKIQSEYILKNKNNLDDHVDALEIEIDEKKTKINNAIDYLSTGLNKPSNFEKDFKGVYNENISEVKVKELDYVNKNIKLESRNTKQYASQFYNDVKNIYLERTNIIKSYEKINSDIKFKNMYLFVIQDLVDLVETFKPADNEKLALISESKVYKQLSKVIEIITEGLEGFMFADYSNDNSIVKYNHFLMFMKYIEMEINLLKELSVAEYVWLQVFDSKFVNILEDSLAIGFNEAWTKSDWSIKDNLDVYFTYLKERKLPVPENYSIMYKDYVDTNIKPLSYIFNNVDVITLLHLLDETVESIAHSYVDLIREDLVNDDILSTQTRLKWFEKHLDGVLEFNVGDGLLVSDYFNSSTAIYTNLLLKNWNVLDEISFYSLFKLCVELNGNIPIKNIKLLDESLTIEEHILKLLKAYIEIKKCISGFNEYRNNIKSNLKINGGEDFE